MRKRRDGDATTLHLPHSEPYDWSTILGFFRARAIPGVESVEGERYRRSVALGDRHGFIDIRPSRAGGPCLQVRIHAPGLPASALTSVVARIERVFDLQADATTINAHLARDELLVPLVARRPGVRIAGGWTDFELAVRAVLGQQITLAGARKLAGDLVAAFAERLDPRMVDASGGVLTHLFPGPARLASADVAGALAMPRARAGTIQAVARALLENAELLQSPRDLDEATARLRRLPGIGDWSAQYIAMRAMREGDAFPSSDVVLLRVMARLTGERPTPKALVARAEPWRPWRAYAAAQLWAADSDLRAGGIV